MVPDYLIVRFICELVDIHTAQVGLKLDCAYNTDTVAWSSQPRRFACPFDTGRGR